MKPLAPVEILYGYGNMNDGAIRTFEKQGVKSLQRIFWEY